MQITERLNELKSILSKGDVETVVTVLKDEFLPEIKNIVDERDYNEIEALSIKLSSDFHTTRNNDRRDTFSREEVQRSYSKITFGIIDLINHVNTSIEKKDIITKNNFNSGFIRIDPKKAMELAAEKIKNSQSMKIIGIGRQNLVEENAHNNNHVIEYYKAIQERFKSIPETGRPFHVKRITQHELKDKFENHLKKCFEIIDEDGNNNKYEIVLYGDLSITYTYYIIRPCNDKDEIFLFLTLNTTDFNTDIRDNTLVFYTNDVEIINQFNRHFDQFWNIEGQKGRVIKNLSDFGRYIPFKKEIYPKYKDIKNFIKRVPNDSVREIHLEREIEIFHGRLEKLDRCFMEYTHANRNQRISNCFTDYIKDLGKGKKYYKALSVRNFWETHCDIIEFLEQQKISLENNDARIERIYLVDSKEIEQENNSKAERNIAEGAAIRENYSQHITYPNFSFSILFSTDEKEIPRRKNYAIWANEDINYKVLFLLMYSTNPFAKTELTFANFAHEENTYTHKNQKKLREYESKIHTAKKRVIEQNDKLLDYLKRKEAGEAGHNETYEMQLGFLKKNGISDIKNFLQIKKTSLIQY